MNPRELVDYIRSGPTQLVLDKPLRFRRRTLFNPCDFNQFLQALQSSETIRTVLCESHRELGITEDEWVLLVKTLGSIKGIKDLQFLYTPGSCVFHPFQAVADAVNNARSLCQLTLGLEVGVLPRDPSGLTALAGALRQHTTLQEFTWVDYCTRVELETVQSAALDHVLRTLPTCPHLRKVFIKTDCASADAMKTLLQLPKNTILFLVLNTGHCLAVADGIRQGRCNIKCLNLEMLQI
jgi:hypothetical protein